MTYTRQKLDTNKPINITDYYQSLGRLANAKTDFVRSVAKKCAEYGAKTHTATIRNWILGNGETQSEARLMALSEVSGIPVENLFKTF